MTWPSLDEVNAWLVWDFGRLPQPILELCYKTMIRTKSYKINKARKVKEVAALTCIKHQFVNQKWDICVSYFNFLCVRIPSWAEKNSAQLAWGGPKDGHCRDAFLQFPVGCPRPPGWWYTYPSEKYKSQLGWLLYSQYMGKNVPNHQPENPLKSPRTSNGKSSSNGHVSSRAARRPIFSRRTGSTAPPMFEVVTYMTCVESYVC